MEIPVSVSRAKHLTEKFNLNDKQHCLPLLREENTLDQICTSLGTISSEIIGNAARVESQSSAKCC